MVKSDNVSELKSKSLTGIGTLFRRQVIIKVIAFIGNVILARLLAPQIFGIYAIVTFVVQFFSTFSDVGLGAALIQKKEELTREELSTTFWLQQGLVWLVAVLIFITAPLVIKNYPSLSVTGVWLIRAMAVSFILSSLKTIPMILMERNLEFNRIAWVDIAESFTFQITVVVSALFGMGVWSFVVASVFRGIVGTVIIYLLSSWRPAFHYHFDIVRSLVRFGLPYQGNNILSFIKDAVTPLFVGAYAGAAAVGYVNWAKNIAFMPMIISESYGRVAFPAFSRIQHDKELLTKAIERSIRSITLIMFPVTAVMIALGPEITRIIFTSKWMPGIWAFYLFCTSPGCIGIFLPLYSAILSLGKSKILLIMTVGLVFFEWGLGIPFIIKFGFTGAAMSQPFVVLLFTYIYYRVLKEEDIRVRIIENISWQLIIAGVTGILIKVFIKTITANLFSLIFTAILGLTLYLIFMYLVKRTLLYEFAEYARKVMGREG